MDKVAGKEENRNLRTDNVNLEFLREKYVEKTYLNPKSPSPIETIVDESADGSAETTSHSVTQRIAFHDN